MSQGRAIEVVYKGKKERGPDTLKQKDCKIDNKKTTNLDIDQNWLDAVLNGDCEITQASWRLLDDKTKDSHKKKRKHQKPKEVLYVHHLIKQIWIEDVALSITKLNLKDWLNDQ